MRILDVSAFHNIMSHQSFPIGIQFFIVQILGKLIDGSVLLAVKQNILVVPINFLSNRSYEAIIHRISACVPFIISCTYSLCFCQATLMEEFVDTLSDLIVDPRIITPSFLALMAFMNSCSPYNLTFIVQLVHNVSTSTNLTFDWTNLVNTNIKIRNALRAKYGLSYNSAAQVV